MPLIEITTYIQAPVQLVFDLARSIDLHQQSMQHTNEKAVAGRTSGLIELGETVTWQAKHLFRTRQLTSKITEMNSPYYFRDVMIEGDFKSMQHDHFFKEIDDGTEMKDMFCFIAPYGLLGRVAENFFLTTYLISLLKQRNRIIKLQAEHLASKQSNGYQ